MKMIVLALITLAGLSAQARMMDYKCVGQTSDGRKLTVLWDSWIDNRESGRVDLTVDLEGVGPRTTVDLYIGTDEAIDEGVVNSTGTLYLNLFFPFGDKTSKEIRGEFYDRYMDSGKKLELVCAPTRINKN